MARTIAAINTQITNNLVAAAASVGWVLIPAQWSVFDYKKLFCYVVAVSISIFEQLLDAFYVSTEALIATAAPQTGKWFQAQMFKFQYSVTDPQVVQFDTTTLAPYYPVVNTTYQVCKYASVTSGALGTVQVKIAGESGGVPVMLDSLTVSAAQAYVNVIQPSGITFVVSSSESDKIYIQAQVYYIGSYSAVISDYLTTAVDNYLKSIPFDGFVNLLDLEIAIRNTTGVNTVVLNNVQIRQDSVAFGSGTDMVLSNATVNRQVRAVAGYVITETDSGHTLVDSLTLIPE